MADRYLKRVSDGAIFAWTGVLAAKKTEFVEVSRAEAEKAAKTPKPKKSEVDAEEEATDKKSKKDEFAGWTKKQLIEYAAENLAFDMPDGMKAADMVKQIYELREEAALMKLL